MNDNEVKICVSIFKTGSETTKEAFTSALARAISRIVNGKPSERNEAEDRCKKQTDT